jgi:hypothetical protein
MDTKSLLLFLSPIIVIELGLTIYALYDLSRPERKVKGDSKLVWTLVILLFNLIGPLLYLFIGREEL